MEGRNISCWIQIGIVSFGYGCGQNENVTKTALPSIYTNVMKYTEWINRQMTSYRPLLEGKIMIYSNAVGRVQKNNVFVLTLN